MHKETPLTYSKKWILLVLVLTTSWLAGCDLQADAHAARAERSALVVDVETLQGATGYAIERSFAGRVEARRQSDVGFELGGELDAVTVEEGDYVTRGQLLARLDTARLEARLAEAEAALEQAKSAQRFAAKTLERSREAAAFEGISAQELDLAIDRANAADATLTASMARVNSVRVDLGKANLVAPYDAVVIDRRIDEGQILAPGQAVLSLQESAPPNVRIGVSGSFAGAMLPGDTQRLTIADRQRSAEVSAVLPVRDPATRTVDVILTVNDADALPGDLARLSLEQRVEEAGFWLPIGALAEGNRGLWTAYVAMPISGSTPTASGATHYLEPRPVEILYEGADRVYVRGALDEGDLFVSGGLARVVPNQQVRLRRSGERKLAAGS